MGAENGSSYFFEVLVYAGTPDSLEAFLDRKRARWIAPLEEVKDYFPRTYRGALRKFERDFGYPALFNDVVGGIGLFARSRCICGQLYFSSSKRVHRRARNRILDRGEIFASEPFAEHSSAAIFESVFALLQSSLAHPLLRRRHLDLDAFEKLGRLLDWRSLLHPS